MTTDYRIELGMYLVQGEHELDLHNNFDFKEVNYSVAERSVTLKWERSPDPRARDAIAASVCIRFEGVSEFRFKPRDPELPFTEDDCLSEAGYWTGEEWGAGGVMLSGQSPHPEWLTAFRFMSRATIVIKAKAASATIQLLS